MTQRPREIGRGSARRYVLADKLAADVVRSRQSRRPSSVEATCRPTQLAALTCAHPLRAARLWFRRSPARRRPRHRRRRHGLRPYRAQPRPRGLRHLDVERGGCSSERGIDTRIPYTVDENGAFTEEAPGFDGKRVLTDKGEKGDANEAVIKALIEAGALIARGRLKHQYPAQLALEEAGHLPQHAAMVHRDGQADRATRRCRQDPLRERPRWTAIGETRWVPASGENRIRGMVDAKPDWVMSRQRAWGVPIAVFVRKGEHEPLVDERVNKRIADAFEKEGADAWYAEGAAARFLAPDYDPADYEKVDDMLDVWFDSGSTHAYRAGRPDPFPRPRRHPAARSTAARTR